MMLPSGLIAFKPVPQLSRKLSLSFASTSQKPIYLNYDNICYFVIITESYLTTNHKAI